MRIKLDISSKIKPDLPLLAIVNTTKDLSRYLSSKTEISYVSEKLKTSQSAALTGPEKQLHFIQAGSNASTEEIRLEKIRRAGADISLWIEKEKVEIIQIAGGEEESLAIAEGLMLAGYRYHKHKSNPEPFPLKGLIFTNEVSKEKITELKNLIKATWYARDLVNEPVIFLTAEQLSEEIKSLGKEAGFRVEVFNKKKIESLKMGGLLGVNKGSTEPPTFNILEYKPSSAVNKHPYILVGKGVVYDTGGLSLKPNDSMKIMKCDMAGAAAVTGAIYAIASNKLPVHVIGLIPATDNRPGEEAITPGDVITISGGKTVEVLNTDAEGRLILADALVYASKYKPKLVIDLATLTGAAARAIGREGIVFMGNADKKYKKQLRQSGEEVYERLVEFPLWEEYGKLLQSDIADLKNVSEGDAGAITAGKFLENFVDYDWLHLDIAGPAFLSSADAYRTKNASGVGVRLLYNFFKNIH